MTVEKGRLAKIGIIAGGTVLALDLVFVPWHSFSVGIGDSGLSNSPSAIESPNAGLGLGALIITLLLVLLTVGFATADRDAATSATIGKAQAGAAALAFLLLVGKLLANTDFLAAGAGIGVVLVAAVAAAALVSMRDTSLAPAVAPTSATSSEPSPGPRQSPRAYLRGRTGRLVAGLIVLVAAYIGALVFLRPVSTGRTLSVGTLLGEVSAGTIKDVTFLDQDARITGLRVRPDGRTERFWTAYPRSDAATNDLLRSFVNSGASVAVDAQNAKSVVRFVTQFLLPLVILADLFALLFTGSKGQGGDDLRGFSQIGDRRVGKNDRNTPSFQNIAALPEAIAELVEVRDFLSDPRKFEKMGALAPKGILIVGPPGCGKTLLGRALAGEAKASFFTVSGSEFVESLVGVGAARVRDLFAQARRAAPAIVFIDELDAVGRQRGAGLGGGHDEREQTLNELLVQMDGFLPTDRVVVLAATNRPDILDPALLRPGRFDRHITVDRPDIKGRLAILRLHARNKPLADAHADLVVMARRTPGFSGADLAAALNEAALLAVREGLSVIERPHLEEAVERVIAGPKRQGILISDEDKRRIAYHEAGHAVVASAFGRGDRIEKVSVISRGKGIGHLALLSEDRLLPTRSDMEAQVAIAMGGVAAEELLFGEPSIGSESDLERATNTARDMAGRFGMSSRLGRVRVLREHREVFLGRDYLLTRDVSQPTLEHLDVEVRRILDQEEANALHVLSANRAVLEDLADALIAQETVQDEALAEILNGVAPFVRAARNGAAAKKAKDIERTPAAEHPADT